jgi:hypothetical protein
MAAAESRPIGAKREKERLIGAVDGAPTVPHSGSRLRGAESLPLCRILYCLPVLLLLNLKTRWCRAWRRTCKGFNCSDVIVLGHAGDKLSRSESNGTQCEKKEGKWEHHSLQHM